MAFMFTHEIAVKKNCFINLVNGHSANRSNTQVYQVKEVKAKRRDRFWVQIYSHINEISVTKKMRLWMAFMFTHEITVKKLFCQSSRVIFLLSADIPAAKNCC